MNGAPSYNPANNQQKGQHQQAAEQPTESKSPDQQEKGIARNNGQHPASIVRPGIIQGHSLENHHQQRADQRNQGQMRKVMKQGGQRKKKDQQGKRYRNEYGRKLTAQPSQAFLAEKRGSSPVLSSFILRSLGISIWLLVRYQKRVRGVKQVIHVSHVRWSIPASGFGILPVRAGMLIIHLHMRSSHPPSVVDWLRPYLIYIKTLFEELFCALHRTNHILLQPLLQWHSRRNHNYKRYHYFHYYRSHKPHQNRSNEIPCVETRPALQEPE